MFENLTKSVSHMVSLIWKFSRGGWRTAFLQATQNGAQTAIVFARQSKMHILKSSGFWFYNIITHWGHPGKGVQKSNQNWNVEAKNRESNQRIVIAINRENRYTTNTDVQLVFSWAPKLARKCESKHWFPCGEDEWSLSQCMVTWLPKFLGWADFLSYGAPHVEPW